MNGDSADRTEPSGRVDGIFHPVISVSRMADVLRFYRDLLGLRVTFDDWHEPAAIAQLFGFENPRLHSAIVECPDGTEIELVEFEQPRGRPLVERGMPDAGLAALNVRVSGIAGLVDRIRSAGFAVPSGIVEQTLPDGAVLSVAVCRAPDGVTVILVEPPAGRRSLGGNG